MDTNKKQLRHKVISLVKVAWEGLTPEEATWEIEDDIRQKYPYLFDEGNFKVRGRNF